MRPGDDLVERASPGPILSEEDNPTVRQMQALRMPTTALVASRHLLRGAGTRSLDQQLDVELHTQITLGRTHDYLEGVAAFMQKRAP